MRVVPNKFPALPALFQGVPGAGIHEVIIESPRHADHLATMDEAAVARVLWAWQQRIRAAKRDPRIAYAVVFKNHGAMAGATLAHAHSQFMALPIVPEFVGSVLHGAREGHARTGRCVFCTVVEDEARAGVRVVEEGGGSIAFEPYASRFPFETWIVPRAHQARFEDAAEAEIRDLAGRLRSVLRRIDRALDRPVFNLVLHTAPFAEEAGAWAHWRLEILPKVTRPGGFEWGTGFFINLMAPERAAEVLRSAEV